MRALSFVFVVASAGALATSGAAVAGDAVRYVSYDDLQLTTPAGLAELERRIDKAAWRVCMYDASGDLRTSEERIACYRSTQKTAEIQVAQLVAERRLAAEASSRDAGG